MMQAFSSHHFQHSRGWERPDDPSSDVLVPAGGHTFGPGFAIAWQNGPLGRGKERQAPNGAFVETILEAAADRLRFYQRTRFACESNEKALGLVEQALGELYARTAEREARGVEGTHAT